MKNKLNFKQSIIAGLLSAVAAAIINALLFITFKSTGILSDQIEIQPGVSLTIVPVLISSIFPALIASMVFLLFEKFTKNGYKIFKIVAVVLLFLSFSNPFIMIPNVPLSYGIALNIMHIVVVGSLLYFIHKSSKKLNVN